MYDISKSILQRVEHPLLDDRQVKLYLKRDDLIDVDVSGNKWRKLKYNIEQCNFRKNEGILTFGGAFSNHLLATAAACDQAGLKSIGIVRGDELNENSNPTLAKAHNDGMSLEFVSRTKYRALRNNPKILSTIL